MGVLHAAVFAYGKPLAGSLKFFFTDIRLFGRFKAFGSAFMGGSHGSVAADVFFGFFIGMARCRKCGSGKNSGDKQVFFHESFLFFKEI